MPIRFQVNGKQVSVDAGGDTPLIWILREHLGLTGTKPSCGIAECGACTIHIDGESARSCVVPLSDVEGTAVTTIEGLSEDRSHPLQKAWIDEQVPQCGYCQPGQIMQAASLLNAKKAPTREEIVKHMDDVLCRCGTYGRVIRAIERVVKESRK
jgi:isoquinoline 1-oxidoreductase alpha subunit